MSANEELLTKIVNVLGGEEAVNIIKSLNSLGRATDDELSARTNVRLNTTRKILYNLYNYSLVTVERIRDGKTGWFIFYWRLQPDQVEGFIQNQKRKILEKLESRLRYEQKHDFYHCGTPNCKRVVFEDTVELVFRCPTCGKTLQHVDNEKIIEVLTNKIEAVKKELSE
ncbi:MAG TPA: transcription factor [archaeon]|nr:transcription factor [archaeon]